MRVVSDHEASLDAGPAPGAGARPFTASCRRLAESPKEHKKERDVGPGKSAKAQQLTSFLADLVKLLDQVELSGLARAETGVVRARSVCETSAGVEELGEAPRRLLLAGRVRRKTA